VLRLASEKRLHSISVPAISAGIFGFPKDRCAKILVGETAAFLSEPQDRHYSWSSSASPTMRHMTGSGRR